MSTTNLDPLGPGQWSKLPNWVLESGALQRLTKAAARVYMAMDLSARWRAGGTISLGEDVLACQTGLSAKSVRTALSQLVREQLVVRLRRGGGNEGDVAVYRIATGPKNRKAASGSQPVETEPTTGRNGDENRKKRVQEPEASYPHYRDTECTEQQSAGTVAGELRQELEKHGIHEPAVGRLLKEFPDLTPKIIDELARRAGKGLNPAGLLIRLIETEATGLIDQHRKQEAATRTRTAADAERRSAAESDRQKVARDRAERDAALGSLSPEELSRLAADATGQQDQRTRDRWRDADPHTHAALRRAMYGILLGNGFPARAPASVTKYIAAN